MSQLVDLILSQEEKYGEF